MYHFYGRRPAPSLLMSYLLDRRTQQILVVIYITTSFVFSQGRVERPGLSRYFYHPTFLNNIDNILLIHMNIGQSGGRD